MIGGSASDWGLRTSAVAVCTSLLRVLPKSCGKHVPLVLGPVWTMLTSGARVYSEAILTGCEPPSDGADEDGE